MKFIISSLILFSAVSFSNAGNLRVATEENKTDVVMINDRDLTETDINFQDPNGPFNPPIGYPGDDPTPEPLPDTDREDGEECSTNSHCKDGSTCWWNSVCRPAKNLFENCDYSNQCKSGHCAIGTYILRWCAPYEDAKCYGDDDNCAPGYHCPTSSFPGQLTSCVPLYENGTGCYKNSECKSDYCNLWGSCHAKLDDGIACTTHHMCDSGHCKYIFPYFRCV